MSVTDPIADLLTRIRNGNMAYHDVVEIPGSKLKVEIVRILQEEGFIRGYDYLEDNKQGVIRVRLKYGPKKERVITNLKRISKPGLRVYTKSDKVPRVLRGLGIAILTTSRGVMADRDARRQGLGGEVLCYVW
ncbi:MAG: 30S ribosomal protein S8 [Armatimonadetes bacterium]|nr:30S ribosomal protein S8 [Armatimonadota bacterium]